MNILEIKNLSIFYKEKSILEDFNLDIKENEIICIMGSSGSGKSTLLSCLNGFLIENGGNYTGDVFFRGENIKNIKPIELKRKISTLFQDSKPFDFSIEKNITYAMEFYEGKVKNKKEKVKNLLESVNLYDEVKDNLSLSPSKLSGGQRQRLCIARMLTTCPEVLIFDEPCSSLDEKNSIIIESLIKELSKKYTIIISTHNEKQANRLADRIIRIENKKLI
ncbi:ATP-binding cassette domain-containing protein [Parvimonas micra]|uniref:ABC transporter, ATP-binding protein n=1 Tax=Parvimonas micra ATCC 33270 TaxID=411465 RepID=A8SJB8_9FIRM|nr:ATP-binding cassette domain-containing protein [Parvimonas micra]EDP24415.1 ABC transporter, ATP-binding protein [Parvimonas micra ATCC 33270]MEB3059948.1 ATP-binding cassette domain-containing protein [Parvimonas micra]MEB3067120.1 ATP-binding cassette domain-containing protein [Parvimonas micra]RSB91284.1 ATP-binding cassette domain-containing protein [Parvimonas micra]WBB31956.1 ATP-binding cassette domain-containing protein [Parvimonas micra]